MAGLEGALGDYKWQLAYTRGESELHTTGTVVSNQLLAAALDAVVDPATGNTVCQASLTNSFYSNCVPFNAFGPTATTQAMVDYVSRRCRLLCLQQARRCSRDGYGQAVRNLGWRCGRGAFGRMAKVGFRGRSALASRPIS